MISDLIKKEEERQQDTIDLIASENYVSDAVKAALGSGLTNKYAEGTPGARYYAGNKIIDEIEIQVNNLAQQLFNTDYHVNAQAYSGSTANLAVYYAFLQPGDVFMGLELPHGGHLTHGHPATLTGKLFKRIDYHVHPATFTINYEELEKLAFEHKPKLIISGASAYPRAIDFQRIGEISKKVGAIHLADISHIAGLVATGLHSTPFDHADIIMTTTHKTLRGPRGALLFCRPEYAKQIDKAVFPGLQGGPHMNNIAAIGVALEEALQDNFNTYCKTVIENAQALAVGLKENGITIITGGTDNHLLLIDLRPLGISGLEAQQKLETHSIIANMNTIPYDEGASPRNPNGLRLGTPAITTRGMTPAEMPALAKKITEVLTEK